MSFILTPGWSGGRGPSEEEASSTAPDSLTPSAAPGLSDAFLALGAGLWALPVDFAGPSPETLGKAGLRCRRRVRGNSIVTGPLLTSESSSSTGCALRRLRGLGGGGGLLTVFVGFRAILFEKKRPLSQQPRCQRVTPCSCQRREEEKGEEEERRGSRRSHARKDRTRIR
jgi:hypothetical protein